MTNESNLARYIQMRICIVDYRVHMIVYYVHVHRVVTSLVTPMALTLHCTMTLQTPRREVRRDEDTSRAAKSSHYSPESHNTKSSDYSTHIDPADIADTAKYMNITVHVTVL